MITDVGMGEATRAHVSDMHNDLRRIPKQSVAAAATRQWGPSITHTLVPRWEEITSHMSADDRQSSLKRIVLSGAFGMSLGRFRRGLVIVYCPYVYTYMT